MNKTGALLLIIMPGEPHGEIQEVQELWDADPNCEHDIQPATGGGVRCTKCSGWFCY